MVLAEKPLRMLPQNGVLISVQKKQIHEQLQKDVSGCKLFSMQTSTTKNDLVESLCRELDFSKKEVQEVVDALFETIREGLEKGNTIKLPGFGNFTIRSKNARVGRNPKTGEEIEITARQVLTFKPSSILRDRIQKGSKKS
jgi:integration host factor subunit alpha